MSENLEDYRSTPPDKNSEEYNKLRGFETEIISIMVIIVLCFLGLSMSKTIWTLLIEVIFGQTKT